LASKTAIYGNLTNSKFRRDGHGSHPMTNNSNWYSMPHGSQSASILTEDKEHWEDYVKGSYHPVKIGDAFSNSRYVVVRKLLGLLVLRLLVAR
jgi:hypothetical protein